MQYSGQVVERLLFV